MLVDTCQPQTDIDSVPENVPTLGQQLGGLPFIQPL